MRKESYGEPTDGEDRSAEESKAIGQAKMMWTFLSKPAQGPINPGEIQFDRTLPCCMGGRTPTIAKTFVLRYTWRRRHRFRASPTFQYRRAVFPGVFLCDFFLYIAFLRGALYHFFSEEASLTRDVDRRGPSYSFRNISWIFLSLAGYRLPWTYTIRRPTMATNTKMLELTFNVEGGRSMILSIPSPKEDLTLATVKEKAALIIPVLE